MIMSDGCLYIEQSSSSCQGGAEAAKGAGATKAVMSKLLTWQMGHHKCSPEPYKHTHNRAVALPCLPSKPAAHIAQSSQTFSPVVDVELQDGAVGTHSAVHTQVCELDDWPEITSSAVLCVMRHGRC